MCFGVLSLKKIAISLLVLFGLGVTLISCYSSSNYQNPSRTKFRAFISNALHPTGVSNVPVIEIMNATTDVLSPSPIDLSGGLSDAGAMDLSSNKKLTLVYSPTNNAFALIDNTTEKATIATMSLPDSAESFLLGVDIKHAYAAVPNASVNQQPPGAVFQVDLSTGTISAALPIPQARFIAQDIVGAHIFVFGDNSSDACADHSGTVTVITTANIGTNTDPRLTVCGFDHPVGAVLPLGGSVAYVLECGPECGGTTAAVAVLDLSTNTVTTHIPVPAATVGLADGNSLYVAGSAPDTPCPSGTQAVTCGNLTVIDTLHLVVANSNPIVITDGYHTRMERGAGGQLYIGSTHCSNLNTSSEVRGCLSIFDTTSAGVKFPPDNGDVTGIAPIPGRNVVYVIEGGELRVYDTTTGALLPNHQTDIVGQLVDVKVVDNPVP